MQWSQIFERRLHLQLCDDCINSLVVSTSNQNVVYIYEDENFDITMYKYKQRRVNQ